MTATAMLANALVLLLFRSMTSPDSEDHRIGEGRETGGEVPFFLDHQSVLAQRDSSDKYQKTSHLSPWFRPLDSVYLRCSNPLSDKILFLSRPQNLNNLRIPW